MKTKTEAIAQARDRVLVVRFGRGWVIHHYQPKVGTRVSHEMTYAAAIAAARETKLREALHLMGWPADDAAMEASRAEPGTRWESKVRPPDRQHTENTPTEETA